LCWFLGGHEISHRNNRKRRALLVTSETKRKEKENQEKTQKAHRLPSSPSGERIASYENPAYAWRFTPRIEPATSLAKAQGT
jgi:hypothetical protein